MPSSLTALLTAIIDDDRAKVKALLKRDAHLVMAGVGKPDKLERKIAHWIYVGDSALHVAAAGYRVEIAKLLLAAGADARAAKNRRSSQPLHYAADGCLENPSWNARRQVATLGVLLLAGADINAQDQNGATPLHRAVRTRCADAVRYLLRAGADPAIRNKPGSTPFHLAVQNTGRGGSGTQSARAAQREIIHAFLENGVSPDLKDSKGKTVLERARNDEIRKLLTTE